MSALMGDVLSGRVSPSVANAACNAGGKLLRVVELQLRSTGSRSGPLMLTNGGAGKTGA